MTGEADRGAAELVDAFERDGFVAVGPWCALAWT